jgi:peptide-methionine (S)-S-oxide reductase
MNTVEKATFGGGCFWGVEARFRECDGVISTRVGYSGGITENPTYKDVCTNTTGHAEVVEVLYDPKKLSYEKLLDIFFDVHDPTQINRQGVDIGTQYRTVIFYHSERQKNLAEQKKKNLDASGRYRKPIATQILPAVTFWEAEDYHQQYLEKQGRSTCSLSLKRS